MPFRFGGDAVHVYLTINKARYIEQLNSRPEAAQFADDVRNLLHDANITLLYAARDPHINHVVILRDWLLERLT